MRAVTLFESTLLKRMGRRLRHWRLQRDESQTAAAERLGVSLSTLRRMESGVDSIPIVFWLRALDIYGIGMRRLETILGEPPHLLEDDPPIERLRASRRRQDQVDAKDLD